MPYWTSAAALGAFLRAMKDESWTLHGIEISPEEAKTAEANTGARVFVGDLLDAPFAPKTFDVITALHVLEHVYHPQDVVKRLWQWLKPGGIVYLQIPNIYGFEARLFRSYWFGLELPRHLYHFSPGSLRRLFSEAKFEEVLVSTLPDCYVEKSIRYLVDDVLANAGIHRTPLATAEPTSSLGWRIIRKSLRVGVLQPFRQLSSALERGPAIEAIFRKTT